MLIGTRPDIAEDTIRECDQLGIRNAWMHRGPGHGSVSEKAAAYGREHGMTVIAGGWRRKFAPPDDPGHRAMRALTGNVPRRVPLAPDLRWSAQYVEQWPSRAVRL